MKIVFLGDALAEHLRRWSKFFAGLGHEVHVITWNAKILDGFEPVVVHRLEKPVDKTGPLARVMNLWRLRGEVRRLIREIQPDLIHAHSAGAYAWMAWLSGFRPIIVTPWGDDVLIVIRQSSLDRFFTVRALRKAELVHCDGENMREVLVKLGVDPARIVIVTFGVDVKKFAPGAPPPAFLEKYGLAGRKIVVSTRTLNPVHNIESVVRAVPAVVAAVPDARFLIVAGGAEEEMLHELADSLGVRPAIAFTGRVEEEEMVTCLQAAHVYVSTSLSESGLASSTAEAMACGLPVINTDTGDIRDWIGDGDGGFVAPVKSPEFLAEKIIYLLRHEDERKQFGARNRAVIEERYNVYVEMKKMEGHYLKLVAEHRLR